MTVDASKLHQNHNKIHHDYEIIMKIFIISDNGDIEVKEKSYRAKLKRNNKTISTLRHTLRSTSKRRQPQYQRMQTTDTGVQ